MEPKSAFSLYEVIISGVPQRWEASTVSTDAKLLKRLTLNGPRSVRKIIIKFVPEMQGRLNERKLIIRRVI